MKFDELCKLALSRKMIARSLSDAGEKAWKSLLHGPDPREAITLNKHVLSAGDFRRKKAVEAARSAKNSPTARKLLEMVGADNYPKLKKTAGVPFEQQDRPEKVKEIWRALKRDHPDMPAEVKARIASRKGKSNARSRKSPKDGGPDYKAPITHERVGHGEDAKYVGKTKEQRAKDEKYAEIDKEAGLRRFRRLHRVLSERQADALSGGKALVDDQLIDAYVSQGSKLKSRLPAQHAHAAGVSRAVEKNPQLAQYMKGLKNRSQVAEGSWEEKQLGLLRWAKEASPKTRLIREVKKALTPLAASATGAAAVAPAGVLPTVGTTAMGALLGITPQIQQRFSAVKRLRRMRAHQAGKA